MSAAPSFEAASPSRLEHLEELKRSIEHHLPLLPVAGAQLRDANEQVEQAVAQVGASFHRMAQNARDGASEASNLVGADQEGGIEGLLSNSRDILEHLIDRIVRDGETCRKLVETTEALKKQLIWVERALAEVDSISSSNIILALNAKIEAAHAGQHGAAFGAVAEEIKSQANRSRAITENIRSTTVRLAEVSQATESQISQLACADQKSISHLQLQVHSALAHLESAHGEMRRLVGQANGRNQELTADIGKAVQSLQFQDRLSQRIQHIVEALESMHAELEKRLDPLECTTGGARPKSKADETLALSYTMNRERSVHGVTVGENVAAVEVLEDVEIF